MSDGFPFDFGSRLPEPEYCALCGAELVIRTFWLRENEHGSECLVFDADHIREGDIEVDLLVCSECYCLEDGSDPWANQCPEDVQDDQDGNRD